jgi:very-short-patch-repair endonuclease
VGTAHTFQGGERDVIVFSPVVSDGAPESTQRFLRRTPNLINVALTRGRRRFIVVGDADACRNAGGVLAAVTEVVTRSHAESSTAQAERTGSLDSDAERLLHHALVAACLPVVPKLKRNHIEFDFAITAGPVLIDVECDGGHHTDSRGRLRSADLTRDDMLAAQGITVLRYPDWRCRREPEAVARSVAERFEQLRAQIL